MFYVINYTDYISGVSCGGATVVLPTSCKDGLCSHSFTANSSTPCSAPLSEGITVTVHAVNVLGKGPTSRPISILTPQISGMYTYLVVHNDQYYYYCTLYTYVHDYQNFVR